MSETNETSFPLEISETALIEALEKAKKTSIDINKIVEEVRTRAKQCREEKGLVKILNSYPEEMQWNGPVGLE